MPPHSMLSTANSVAAGTVSEWLLRDQQFGASLGWGLKALEVPAACTVVSQVRAWPWVAYATT